MGARALGCSRRRAPAEDGQKGAAGGCRCHGAPPHDQRRLGRVADDGDDYLRRPNRRYRGEKDDDDATGSLSERARCVSFVLSCARVFDWPFGGNKVCALLSVPVIVFRARRDATRSSDFWRHSSRQEVSGTLGTSKPACARVTLVAASSSTFRVFVAQCGFVFVNKPRTRIHKSKPREMSNSEAAASEQVAARRGRSARFRAWLQANETHQTGDKAGQKIDGHSSVSFSKFSKPDVRACYSMS